jgi:hypothetical protein
VIVVDADKRMSGEGGKDTVCGGYDFRLLRRRGQYQS